MPFHTQPIGSFWGEWWAVALGLAATAVGAAGFRRALPLPATLAIPAVLVVVILVQLALGRLAFPQLGLLYCACLLWAGLLLILGRALADTVGLADVADFLAVGFAVGALIGAAAALAQWLGLAGPVPWVFPKLGGNVYGNLGQPNHHAHYSWLGIASLFYLNGRGHVRRPVLWLAAIPLVLASVLSGSRSVFIYPFVLLAATALPRLRASSETRAFPVADAVILLPVLLVLSVFAAWTTRHLAGLYEALGSGMPASAGAIVASSRLPELVSASSARMEIGRSAIFAFIEHPWLGQGAGNYAWASFAAAAENGGATAFVVAENAHNLILQLMVEFGGPAAAMVIVMLGYWVRRFLDRSWGAEHAWIAAMLGIGLVHALLEYPLWYAYFLGPTALLLGAGSMDRGLAVSIGRGRLYVFAIALIGVGILATLRSDYETMESARYRPFAGHPDRENAWRISMDRLARLHRESLLSPWALLAIANLDEPGRLLAEDRADLCKRGMRLSPDRASVTRCAMQLAIAGRDTDAQKLLRSVLRAFPLERAATVAQLAQGARAYPEILPLWRTSEAPQQNTLPPEGRDGGSS